MFFWLREITGWLFLLGSLVVLWFALTTVMNPGSPKIVEAAVILGAALGLMRTGLLLIRLSTAARLSSIQQADSATDNL